MKKLLMADVILTAENEANGLLKITQRPYHCIRIPFRIESKKIPLLQLEIDFFVYHIKNCELHSYPLKSSYSKLPRT